ncbi:MAG: NAD(P)H-dependent oxidoreductase subunit E [Fretibacterium sp.]|nr:NAD(P)H-dependent oxidoreductase subunit E [Fretibacterium sp.]
MLDSAYYQKTDEILEKYPREERSLIPIIHDVQDEYHYLPPELLSYIAREIGITETKAYSVASFYENFSFEPKGRFVLKVCDGTACHVRQSGPVLQRLREELGLADDQRTTGDMLFTVETVSCLGACGLAPAMTVNDAVHPAMTPEKASELIKELKAQAKDGGGQPAKETEEKPKEGKK